MTRFPFWGPIIIHPQPKEFRLHDHPIPSSQQSLVETLWVADEICVRIFVLEKKISFKNYCVSRNIVSYICSDRSLVNIKGSLQERLRIITNRKMGT